MSTPLPLTGGQVLAMTTLMIFAFAASLAMPFNLDGMVRVFGVSNTEAGVVVSSEMLAIAAGSLLITLASGRFNVRATYAVGLIVIAIAGVASAYASSLWSLLWFRLPAGFALGMVVTTVTATAARSTQPESNFGIINSSVGAMSLIISFVFPEIWVRYTDFGFQSFLTMFYLVYAFFAVAALPFLLWVPVPPVQAATGGAPAAPRFPWQAWIGLIGLGVLLLAQAQLGAFIVKFATGIGIPADHLKYIMMVNSIIAVVVPLWAAQFGQRFQARWWVLSWVALMSILAVVFTALANELAFALVVPIFGIVPLAVIPIYLGALARLDTTGRLAGSNPLFAMGGSAIAPFLGGALIDAGGYLTSAFAVSVLAGLAMLLMWSDLTKSDRLRENSAIGAPVAAAR